jgi:hypothetical protein
MRTASRRARQSRTGRFPERNASLGCVHGRGAALIVTAGNGGRSVPAWNVRAPTGTRGTRHVPGGSLQQAPATRLPQTQVRVLRVCRGLWKRPALCRSAADTDKLFVLVVPECAPGRLDPQLAFIGDARTSAPKLDSIGSVEGLSRLVTQSAPDNTNGYGE